QLKAQVGSGALTVRVIDEVDREDAARVLAEVTGAEVYRESDPTALTTRVDETARAAAALTALEAEGLGIEAFSPGPPSLDEVFLTLTGGPAQPAADETAADEADDQTKAGAR